MINIPFADVPPHSHGEIDLPIAKNGKAKQGDDSFLSFISEGQAAAMPLPDESDILNLPPQVANTTVEVKVLQSSLRFSLLMTNGEESFDAKTKLEDTPGGASRLEARAVDVNAVGQGESGKINQTEQILPKTSASQNADPADGRINTPHFINYAEPDANLAEKKAPLPDQDLKQAGAVSNGQQAMIEMVANNSKNQAEAPKYTFPPMVTNAQQSKLPTMQASSILPARNIVESDQPNLLTAQDKGLAKTSILAMLPISKATQQELETSSLAPKKTDANDEKTPRLIESPYQILGASQAAQPEKVSYNPALQSDIDIATSNQSVSLTGNKAIDNLSANTGGLLTKPDVDTIKTIGSNNIEAQHFTSTAVQAKPPETKALGAQLVPEITTATSDMLGGLQAEILQAGRLSIEVEQARSQTDANDEKTPRLIESPYQILGASQAAQPEKVSYNPALQSDIDIATSNQSVSLTGNKAIDNLSANTGGLLTKPDVDTIKTIGSNNIEAQHFTSTAVQAKPPETKALGAQLVPEITTATSDMLGGLQAEILQAGGPSIEVAQVEQARSQIEILSTRPEVARHVAQQLAEVARQIPDRPIELTLNPEELGRVRLTFTMSEMGINVVVITERGETMDLLRRHIEILAQEFRNMGYKDVSFDFSGHNQGEASHRNSDETSADKITQYLAENEQPEPVRLSVEPLTSLDLRL